MGLATNNDFRRWLAGFEDRHERVSGDGPQAPAGVCDGCGDPLSSPPAAVPYCLVCLAEQYGRDRAEAAERVAAALRVALARTDDALPATDVRAAVEQVLDDYEARLEPIA